MYAAGQIVGTILTLAVLVGIIWAVVFLARKGVRRAKK